MSERSGGSGGGGGGYQMGKEQLKAHVSGYGRCIFAVYFVLGN